MLVQAFSYWTCLTCTYIPTSNIHMPARTCLCHASPDPQTDTDLFPSALIALSCSRHHARPLKAFVHLQVIPLASEPLHALGSTRPAHFTNPNPITCPRQGLGPFFDIIFPARARNPLFPRELSQSRTLYFARQLPPSLYHPQTRGCASCSCTASHAAICARSLGAVAYQISPSCLSLLALAADASRAASYQTSSSSFSTSM